MRLIKTELYKINRTKSKYIFIFSFILIFLISISEIIRYENNTIFEILISCYSFGLPLIVSFGLAAFVVSNICGEFNSKSIKYLIMSGYSRNCIVMSKFFSISLYVSIIYILVTLIYLILSMGMTDVTNVYINFSKISLSKLLIHILDVNFYIWIYLISIISFSMMLSFTFKKVDVILVIFILVLGTIYLMGYDASKYTFFIGMDSYNYIGLYGQFPEKIINILSSISNILFNLFISCMVLKKYQF